MTTGRTGRGNRTRHARRLGPASSAWHEADAQGWGRSHYWPGRIRGAIESSVLLPYYPESTITLKYYIVILFLTDSKSIKLKLKIFNIWWEKSFRLTEKKKESILTLVAGCKQSLCAHKIWRGSDSSLSTHFLLFHIFSSYRLGFWWQKVFGARLFNLFYLPLGARKEVTQQATLGPLHKRNSGPFGYWKIRPPLEYTFIKTKQ